MEVMAVKVKKAIYGFFTSPQRVNLAIRSLARDEFMICRLENFVLFSWTVAMKDTFLEEGGTGNRCNPPDPVGEG